MSESDIPKSLEELREIIVKSIEKEVCTWLFSSYLIELELKFLINVFLYQDSKPAKLQEFERRRVRFLQVKMLVEILHNAQAIRLRLQTAIGLVRESRGRIVHPCDTQEFSDHL